MTARELLAAARGELASAAIEASPREAALLLGHLLGRNEAQLLARDEEEVPPEVVGRFTALLARRRRGEPMAYLLGRREFWGRSFTVDRRVLVPRPETEHLIEAALSLDLPASPAVLDLGTGSGCLAITLALELPGSRVQAVDRSAAALALARHNARQLGARVALLAADWARPLAVAHFDLLVANPPYLDPGEPISPTVAEWEPGAALWAGPGGLAAYRELLASLAGARRRTPVLVEIGAGQRETVASLAAELGWRVVAAHDDYAGLPRVVELRRG